MDGRMCGYQLVPPPPPSDRPVPPRPDWREDFWSEPTPPPGWDRVAPDTRLTIRGYGYPTLDLTPRKASKRELAVWAVVAVIGGSLTIGGFVRALMGLPTC